MDSCLDDSRTKSRAAYLQLKASEFISREEMQKLQSDRLQRIVNHAYQTSKFYRERFDQIGLDPRSIKTIEDISLLPFITKDDIRQNLDAGLISSKIKN